MRNGDYYVEIVMMVDGGGEGGGCMYKVVINGNDDGVDGSVAIRGDG